MSEDSILVFNSLIWIKASVPVNNYIGYEYMFIHLLYLFSYTFIHIFHYNPIYTIIT